MKSFQKFIFVGLAGQMSVESFWNISSSFDNGLLAELLKFIATCLCSHALDDCGVLIVH